MAALSAAKRLARLGWWIGLSAGAMAAATCGAMFSGGCKSNPLATSDAGRDGTIALEQDAAGTPDKPATIVIRVPDASEKEANEPVDGGKSDLWEIICE